MNSTKKSPRITLITQWLNGKAIAYHTDTEFLIQVGKGKSSYVTRYRIVGDLSNALIHYNGLNIHSGTKKRLLMPSCSKNPIIAREITV